jgi:NAD+ kinase
LESKRLQFVVRELYRFGGGGTPVPKLDKGLVEPSDALSLRSMMRDARLFLDGAHRVHAVDFGAQLRMERSAESLTLLGLHPAVRDRL